MADVERGRRIERELMRLAADLVAIGVSGTLSVHPDIGTYIDVAAARGVKPAEPQHRPPVSWESNGLKVWVGA